LLIADHLWQQLSPTQQTDVRQIVQDYAARAADKARQYDGKALTLLHATAGIETITVPDEEVQHFQQLSLQIQQDLAGKLYPPALLTQVLALRQQYRQQ
jgi:TRAP-type C4-dicarboxylate transport system substrate-binding protein